MAEKKYKKFINIGFDDFKKFASDDSLSPNEKIGFPDSYRQGYENHILEDIESKLGEVKAGQDVLDIGPGCSNLAKAYIEKCYQSETQITLVDSQEMLNLLPNMSNVIKVPGFYPSTDIISKLNNEAGYDKIICYSVFHYLFVESNVWTFLDATLNLLKPGGRFLLADIPNFSMRNRYFTSDKGAEFYRKFIKSDDKASDNHKFDLLKEQIDDGVLIGMILRARNRGFHAYIMPQGHLLPMENRREDLLFVKP